jgi:hypothetical protein
MDHVLWRTCFERVYGAAVRDYVITMMMMTMMVTHPYSRRTSDKQRLVREITAVSNGICMLSYSSILCLAVLQIGLVKPILYE